MINQSVNKAYRERTKPDWVTHTAVFLGALLNGFSSHSYAQDYDVTVSPTDDFIQESIQPTFLYHAFQNTSSANVSISLPESIDTSVDDELFHRIINQIDNDSHDLNIDTLLSIDHSLFDNYLESADDDSGIAVGGNQLTDADLIVATPPHHVTTESSSHEVYWIIGGALVLGGITALILTDDSDSAPKPQLKIDSKLLFKFTQDQDNSIYTSLTGKNIIAFHTDNFTLIKSASIYLIDDYSDGDVKISKIDTHDVFDNNESVIFTSSYNENTYIITGTYDNLRKSNTYQVHKLDEHGEFTKSLSVAKYSHYRLDYNPYLLLINNGTIYTPNKTATFQKLSRDTTHEYSSGTIPDWNEKVIDIGHSITSLVFNTSVYMCGFKSEFKSVKYVNYTQIYCYSWDWDLSDKSQIKLSSKHEIPIDFCDDDTNCSAEMSFVSECDAPTLLLSVTKQEKQYEDGDSDYTIKADNDIILLDVKGEAIINEINMKDHVITAIDSITASLDSSLSGESHFNLRSTSQGKVTYDPSTKSHTTSFYLQLYDLKIPSSCDSIEMKLLASDTGKRVDVDDKKVYYEYPAWYKSVDMYINSQDQLTWLSRNEKYVVYNGDDYKRKFYYYLNTINDFI